MDKIIGHLLKVCSKQYSTSCILSQDHDFITSCSGLLDGDETPLEAAERETQEEAGLTKEQLEYLHNFEEKITYDVNGKSKDVYYFLARVRNPDQKITLSDEHKDLSWANLADACKLVKHDSLQSVLRKADDFIKTSLKQHTFSNKI